MPEKNTSMTWGQVQQVVLFDQGLLADTDPIPEGMIQIYIRVRFGGWFLWGTGGRGFGKGVHGWSYDEVILIMSAELHDPRWWFPVLELLLGIQVGKIAELTSSYIGLNIVQGQEQEGFMIWRSLMSWFCDVSAFLGVWSM